MEAFAKSDDERDFYLDRTEGFLIFVDLDKSQEELELLEKELKEDSGRYCLIPKLTFYEIKKLMEGFVHEKVYDIDTKEKLIDIIQSKEARENFLEFIYDHHSELEKWQQYYQERFRVRIIEWLRNSQFDFVFEEDLELTKSMVEKLKMSFFEPRVSKDVAAARKMLVVKAKTYYSNEALNPRPKRGRPPKQVVKVETEPQFSEDIYTGVPKIAKPFLFVPDYHSASAIFTFSGKFTSEADLLAHRRQQLQGNLSTDLQNLQEKLAAIRNLSANWQTPLKDIGSLSITTESAVIPSLSSHQDQVLNGTKQMQSVPFEEQEKGSLAEKTPYTTTSARSKKEKVEEKRVPLKVVKKATPSRPKKMPKARLRPLAKKVIASRKVSKPVSKKQPSPLRMLRRSKKR